MTSKVYFSYLCDFMTVYHDKPKGHYDPKTQQMWEDSFLREVRPHHVRKWIELRAYGVADPGPNDKPTKRRAESCNYMKKALSFFVTSTRTWDPETSTGNPTTGKEVSKAIAHIRKLEVRGQGVKSKAKRDMTLPEFKKTITLLQAEGNWKLAYRFTAMMKTQFSLIGRGDDISHMETKNISSHNRFDFALTTQMKWSKNVREERDCPWQILLGAMDPDFCILLALSIYLEDWMGSGDGMNSRFMFADGIEDSDANKSKKAYATALRDKVFKHEEFLQLMRRTGGSLGSHSMRKFPTTWVIQSGGTQDEVEIRGRWKGKNGARVSSRYINPNQPFIDAKIAGILCVNGPVKYELKSGAGIATEWLREHVVPALTDFFGADSTVPNTLALPLLWAAMEPSMASRVPVALRDRIRTEYEAFRAGSDGLLVGVNPVKKVPLLITRFNQSVAIDVMMEEDGAAPAAQLQQDRTQQQFHQQERSNVVVSQLQTMSLRLSRMEEAVDSTANDLKEFVGNQFSIVHRNVNRLVVLPARQAGNGALPRPPQPARTLTLMKTPRDLGTLWMEYTHGVAGSKPAKDWTPSERGGKNKQTYYRRNTVWRCIAAHVRAGHSARSAMDRIRQVYGRNLSVTKITSLMIKDRARYKQHGGYHPNLRI